MKNIINQIPWSTSSSSSSSSTTTTTSTWGSPSDGSLTNIFRPNLTTGYAIPNNGGTASGFGIRCDECNGQLIDSNSQVLTIKDDNLNDLVVHRHRFPTQRDQAYLDIYCDTEYQNGCLKIQVLKPCWLLIEGTICLEKIGGVNTQSQGCGLLRKNSDTTGWYSPPLGSLTQTVEPAGGGTALPVNIIHYYPAGTIMKVYVCSTIDTSVVRLNSGADGGLLTSETYLAVTRISN